MTSKIIKNQNLQFANRTGAYITPDKVKVFVKIINDAFVYYR